MQRLQRQSLRVAADRIRRKWRRHQVPTRIISGRENRKKPKTEDRNQETGKKMGKKSARSTYSGVPYNKYYTKYICPDVPASSHLSRSIFYPWRQRPQSIAVHSGQSAVFKWWCLKNPFIWKVHWDCDHDGTHEAFIIRL